LDGAAVGDEGDTALSDGTEVGDGGGAPVAASLPNDAQPASTMQAALIAIAHILFRVTFIAIGPVENRPPILSGLVLLPQFFPAILPAVTFFFE
jgi:hypothetical protein